MNDQTPTRFEIIDRKTGHVVGEAKTRKAASRSVDRRDNQYGGYRFTYREVAAQQVA